ncbi:MAG: LuxR C-terminal-related transcriptional regulator [Acidobacteriia bacterium]|nr:LuxR C-terminal-related transcriptional regulator [Terriglobia bacterium]
MTNAGFSDVTALQNNVAPSVETVSEPAISPRESPAADESRVPGGVPRKKEKLPAKTADLSQYLDEAQLTDRQRECFSLKFEYGLRFSAIAHRLGISRKTVDEHIAAARRRMEWSKVKDKIKAKKARLNPEE